MYMNISHTVLAEVERRSSRGGRQDVERRTWYREEVVERRSRGGRSRGGPEEAQRKLTSTRGGRREVVESLGKSRGASDPTASATPAV